MLFASSSFQAGQFVGFGILALIVIGLIRTFSRSDLTWREKIFGGESTDKHSDWN